MRRCGAALNRSLSTGARKHSENVNVSTVVDWTDCAGIEITMGKKVMTTQNINQKLMLAVRSGKHKVGK